MTTYEKNIEALVLEQPNLAVQIFQITENKKYEVFQGEDPVAINILDVEKNILLYDNPINDVVALAELSKDKENLPFRYLYGIGNGVYLKMLLSLPELKRVVLIEEELELLYIAFNLIDFSEEIKTKKLSIIMASELNYSIAYSYLNHTDSKLFARLFDLEFSSNYYTHASDLYKKSLNTMTEAFTHVIVGHGNSPIDSLEGIENHFKNLPDMIKSPKFTKILKSAKKQTAVIVSTGPSLTKQIPLLKKIKDHALIISVDASFPILEKHGIKPDYVTVLERVPETAKFFENNSLAFQKDVNFLCVSIIHEDVKNAIREGNLILQMRPHGYTKYFELDEYGYIGGGMSAANLAHELAVVLEVDNIIFIGQDLAFGEDDTSHAQDHTFTVNEEKTEGHDIFVRKYGGEGEIRTTFYWKLFKDGIEDLIHKTASFIKTVNATEGGARINGSIELSFEDAINQYVDMNFKKTAVPLVYADANEQQVYQQKIIDKTNHMLKMAVDIQEEVEDLFLEVQEVSEHLVKLSEDNRLEEIDFNTLEDINTKIDKVKEYTDEFEFNQLFMDVLQSQIVNLEIEFAPNFITATKTDIDKKTKLIDWVMKHRYWLFVFAGGLDAQRETVIKSISKWPKEYLDHIIIPKKKEHDYDEEKYNRLVEKSKKEQEQRESQMKESLDNIADQLAGLNK